MAGKGDRKQVRDTGYVGSKREMAARSGGWQSTATPMSDPLRMDQTHWMRVMREGQLTRDPVLRTRTEIEEDRRRAEALEARRRFRVSR